MAKVVIVLGTLGLGFGPGLELGHELELESLRHMLRLAAHGTLSVALVVAAPGGSNVPTAQQDSDKRSLTVAARV